MSLSLPTEYHARSTVSSSSATTASMYIANSMSFLSVLLFFTFDIGDFFPPLYSIELTATSVLRCPIYIDRNGGEGGAEFAFLSVSARDFPDDMGEKNPNELGKFSFFPCCSLALVHFFPLLPVTRRPRRRRRPASGGGGRPPRRTETQTFA